MDARKLPQTIGRIHPLSDQLPLGLVRTADLHLRSRNQDHHQDQWRTGENDGCLISRKARRTRSFISSSPSVSCAPFGSTARC